MNYKEKYKSIEYLRENDIILNNGVILKSNTDTFKKGDYLHISEKLDGSNAAFQYLGAGKFRAWSRRLELTTDNNLFGFYQYCEKFVKELYAREVELEQKYDLSDYIFYGEWMGRKNVVKYDDWVINKWFVFDIYSIKNKTYLLQNKVTKICEYLNILQPNVLAIIPNFISWEPIKYFANIKFSFYGEAQEGIIIKNETQLKRSKLECTTLKIVNKQFHESKHRGKLSKKQYNEKINAYKAFKTVVTVNRVQKIIRKLQEDQQIPLELTINDKQLLMSKVPGLIIKDLKKEEPEILKAYNNYHNKAISALTKQCLNSLLI